MSNNANNFRPCNMLDGFYNQLRFFSPIEIVFLLHTEWEWLCMWVQLNSKRMKEKTKREKEKKRKWPLRSTKWYKSDDLNADGVQSQ